MKSTVGVCSWSLSQASDLTGLAALKPAIHLGIDEADRKHQQQMLAAVSQLGLKISACCCLFADEQRDTISHFDATVGLAPAETRDARIKHVQHAISFAAELAVSYVILSVGQIPSAESDEYAKLAEVVSQLASRAMQDGVKILLETGQEPAATLLEFIERLGAESVGVNYDPANFVMLGRDEPVPALSTLKAFIAQAQVHDALATADAHTMGAEVPLGSGDVDVARSISKLRAVGYEGPLVVEFRQPCEASHIREAIAYVQQMFAD